MKAINTAGDGTIFINCVHSAGKWLNQRKMAPGGAINTSKDGVIFVNCIKPFGKALNYLKGKGIPPTVTISLLVVVAVGCAAIYFYKRSRPEE